MPDMPGDAAATGTERAVIGVETAAEVADLLDRYATALLGSPIAGVRWRSGRIDAVLGVDLADGRAAAVKVHRPPVDVEVLTATRSAKETLAASGFPCPAPLAGPDVFEGHVITAETLVPTGSAPGPGDRRLVASGLAEHIAILRARPDLLERYWPGPSWFQYESGPWPVSHDAMVDLSTTPAEYAWLDDLARRASAQIRDHRGDDRVLAHADWYAGNLVVADGRLVGAFDWEFVAQPDAVMAGFAAAAFATTPDGGEFSTPEMAVGFLEDYGSCRGRPLTGDEWRTAAGALAWILAFDSRWQVSLFAHGMGDRSLVERARDRGDAYLAVGS